jgi:formylglycine-generating enzyme required for sulfatase activity
MEAWSRLVEGTAAAAGSGHGYRGSAALGLLTLAWLPGCASSGGAGSGTDASAQVAVMPQVLLSPDDRQPVEVVLPDSGVRFVLVPIPGGSVDGRTVAPFWMSATEVPWQDYLELVFEVPDRVAAEAADGFARPSRPYISIDRGFGQQTRPVISVSARGAQSYCQWLNRKTDGSFRLPSVDEWRLAALAGASSADISQSIALESAGGRTAPVGSLKPNRLGIYDLVGNAAEWALSPEGPVVLGGSYKDPRARLSALLVESPKPSWNQSDPQIPKSTWWLADAGFPGIRVIADELPPKRP